MKIELLATAKLFTRNPNRDERDITSWGVNYRVLIDPEKFSHVTEMIEENTGPHVLLNAGSHIYLRMSYDAFIQEYWREFALPNPNSSRSPDYDEETEDTMNNPESNFVDF